MFYKLERGLELKSDEEEEAFTPEEEEKLLTFGYIKPGKRKRGHLYVPASKEWEDEADSDHPLCK